jgi:peptidylprolyl isomerase
MPVGTSALFLRFGASFGLLLGSLFALGCEGVDPGPSITVPADVKAPPADAKTTASGLAWKVLKAGQGTVHPKATDQVTVHYSGWTTDGALFDSSVTRGAPAQFPLNGVIKGWTEGVQLMVEGEESRFWIPPELAYGNNPEPGYPAGTLVFDIQLISIKR